MAIAVMKTLQSDLEFIISPVASFGGVDYQNRFDFFPLQLPLRMVVLAFLNVTLPCVGAVMILVFGMLPKAQLVGE